MERNHMGLHLENEVAVVKTPTISSNNPVYQKCSVTTPMYINPSTPNDPYRGR